MRSFNIHGGAFLVFVAAMTALPPLAIDMALPSLMKHIRILECSGLVASEKSGRVRTCSLQTEALATIEFWLAAQREIWEQRLDRLEMYVEKLRKEEKANGRKRKSK